MPGMHSLDSIAWGASVVAMVAASGFDLWTRRIPNWLTISFLLSGLMMQSVMGGMPGLGRALAGVALACGIFIVPCFLRIMGMGDLKLIAGVGAWVGPGQLTVALIVTGIVGGLMAVVAHYRGTPGNRPGDASARSIPYAPAIGIGALFSFFAR
jgi:prepilin peptidase CpaA